ncbi:MAG: trypsin-like serine protease, partial [Polyangiaceae bacterium]|nr:trypsin-like serine protease [Polyangiaceae bacterium]
MIVVASGATACSSGHPTNADVATARRQEAIWNGFDDVDTPAANAVVRLQGGGRVCTGTLVSPTLVLTANHCALGSTCGNISGAAAVGASVSVGSSVDAPAAIQADAAAPGVTAARIRRISSLLGAPTDCAEDGDSDLVLVETFPPIVNEALPSRPSLAPIPGGSKSLKTVGWGRTESGANASVRQTGGPFVLAAGVDYEPVDTGEIRLLLTNGDLYGGNDGGDSGGPLLLRRPTGEWDQVGVYSGRASKTTTPTTVNRFTNLTNDGNDGWLATVAADPLRPGKWRGEGDYAGPCDTTLDPDCDRFYDAPICTVTNGKETCKLDDNCPGVYNPAQLASPDVDGDGQADGGPNADADRDGVPDYCDTHPLCSYLLDAKGYDTDGDGLCGEFDALCPHDPLNDADGDGVCDGGGKDNCPGIANDQANCNEEAEAATKSTVLGDACDPVPCPGFVANTISTKECADGGCTTVTTLPVDAPNLTVKAQGSRSVTGAGSEVGVLAATDHRYCIEGEYPDPMGIPVPTRCFDQDAVSDAFLVTPLTMENAASRFHRVHVDQVSSASSQTAPIVYHSSQPEVGAWWRYDLDFPAWATSSWGAGWVKDPTQTPFVPTDQTGRYWMHADTPVGQSQQVGGNGLHTKLNGDPGVSLANHYRAVYPVTQTTYWIPLPSTACPPPFGCFQPFDTCIGGECLEAPCLGGGCEQVCLSCAFGELPALDRYESRVLGAVEGGEIGLLTRAGGFVHLGPGSLSAGARALLANPARGVLRAVEPNRNVGRGLELPQALVLDASSFEVVESLTVRGPSMFTGREVVAADDEHRGGESGGDARALPLVAGVATPRTRPQVLYSSAVGLAFTLGGRDAAGKPLHDLWTYALDAPAEGWTQLQVKGVSLGDVVAATYAYADARLWVLDEVKGPWGVKIARLLKVNPFTGDATVLGAWPRLGAFDRHWLGVDRDGSVLLTASSRRRGGSHLIVRLATRGDVRVTGIAGGRGALAAAPIVDRSGVTLLGPARPGSGAAYDVRRTPSLSMRVGAWA